MKYLAKKVETKRDKMIFDALFYVFIIAYSLICEIIFSVSIGTEFGFFKFIFTGNIGLLLLLSGSISKNKKVNFIIQSVLTCLVSVIYISQLIYFSIFGTTYYLSSLAGAGDAMAFADVAINALGEFWFSYILFVLQIVCLFTFYRKRFFKIEYDSKKTIIISGAFIVTLTMSIMFPTLFTQGLNSPRYLMLNEFVPLSAVRVFGVPVSMALDLKYSIVGAQEFSGDTQVTIVTPSPSPKPSITPKPTAAPSPSPTPIVYGDNVMDIEFNMEEADETLLSMNKYFSNKEPTSQNEYTGMFEGKNLIMVIGETFSPYFIDPELTPTLYKMQSEGINFTNFYTPIWGVSTSDGEYVSTTGLLPKSGVWSYTRTAENYMPFAFGNQFNSLGYESFAFHNHDYTYYNRDKSHPNMGYEFIAKWNGLDITNQWPESDLELIDASVDYYMDLENFHVYYLTMSGHLEHNFYGNAMAAKNREAVEHLPYSDTVKAYIAGNLELEYALTELIVTLEENGQLENTVITLSSDHYPYGMSHDYYAELRGVESLEETFELYENSFFIWNSEIEEPIEVDKVASSLDITPTLSNLFGLEYDSRLMIGQDIFSDSEPLVMFADKSFITEDYQFNSNDGVVTLLRDATVTNEEVSEMSEYVAQQFSMSAAILDNDYYRYLFETEE